MCRCRNFLQVDSLSVEGGQLSINITPETLDDGHWYSLWLPPTNPVLQGLVGTETVFVVNGSQDVQVADWRGRALLSERLMRGFRLRMVYSKNSIAGASIFETHAGIVPLP